MTELLMPKATTVWLVDNTTLTFKQIANFVSLHELEVQAIADGEVGSHIQPYDPVTNELLTQDDINECQKNPNRELKLIENDLPLKKQKGQKYTPINKRSAKPNAIAWLIRHYPEIKDNQIIKLIGTTKLTIEKVKKDADYRNEKANHPASPVELGLCSKNELDALTSKIK